MFLHRLLTYLIYILAPAAIISNSYLYTYPCFHLCRFPQQRDNGHISTRAPFRLLAFGDPQLEGDTSLPDPPYSAGFDSSRLIEYIRYRQARPAYEYILETADDLKEIALYHIAYLRKRLDLLGNDFYLAHIYRTLQWYTKPTHVTVLGDLLGSQWIRDEEFSARSNRFWNRVFRGASVVPSDKLLTNKSEDGLVNVAEEILGQDPSWSTRIMNVPGNHDIGYAGDIDEGRVERFERAFGPVNGMIRFKLNETESTLRIVVLNSMNMDSPQLSDQLAWDTLSAINDAIVVGKPVEDHNEAVILLTHIPLHKQSGICMDSPMFAYFEGGNIKEQNFLSYDTGRDAILHGIFGLNYDSDGPARGLGRDGIILTGHDHEGCDVYHHANRETLSWEAKRWSDSKTSALVEDGDQPGIREVTVRSMMGDYGGNAALVSAWWSDNTSRWVIEVQNCPFVVQHVWWAVHILDIVLLVVCTFWTLTRLSQVLASRSVLSTSPESQPVHPMRKLAADALRDTPDRGSEAYTKREKQKTYSK